MVIINFFSRIPYPSPSRILQHVVNTSYNPSSVAVDSPNDHVYWVFHSGNILSRCTLDGTNVVVFTSPHSNNIFTIRLDLKNRYDIITHH